MSTPKDLSGTFMPHQQARTASGTLAAVNAEQILTLSGDASATIFINGTGTFAATYNIEASPDWNGTTGNFYPLACYPYSPASVGGTLPLAGQPLVTEAVNAATVTRLLCAATGGMKAIKVRLSAYTSGSAAVTLNADECPSINPYIRDQKAATLMLTATAAVSTAVTAGLPAVAGLRHYIDRIDVNRSATAALTASATPVLVTTTNMPGSPALTFGQDAGGIGVDKIQSFDFGGAGMAASLAGTATTIVCPLYTGVIWRINVSYRLGL
jgi:hypothetical protein